MTLAIGGDSEKFAKGRHCEDIAGGLGITIGGNDWGERRKKSKPMHGLAYILCGGGWSRKF